MAKFIGRLVDLGIARETSRGTYVTPAFYVPKVDFSFDDKVVKTRSLGSLGKITDSEESFVTTLYGEGEIGGEIRDKSFGLFLYALLGACATTGPTDSTYSHAFSLSHTNQHTSLSLTVKDSNTTEQYSLSMLNELEILAELDEVVKYRASFLSKQARGASYSPSPAAENKFTKKHLSFKVAANIAGLAAASALSLKSLRLNFAKNVVLDDVLGTAEPEDILNQMMSIEGQVTLNYEDETWKNYMKQNSSKAVQIAFTNSDVYAAGATNPSLTMQFPKVDFFDWEPDYSLDEIVTQTISFKASRDVSGGADAISTCTLVNAQTSY